MLEGFTKSMGDIRYAIAGSPVKHSLSPLLTALVCDALGLTRGPVSLHMELVDATRISDALAWGYAGAVPQPMEWDSTQSPFGKFRTTALLEKAMTSARQIEEGSPYLTQEHDGSNIPTFNFELDALPTRMFKNEIWMNLTSPLKHQLDSDAVVCIDQSMEYKSINALRWDGKGWWCGGFDGLGVCEVFQHLGFEPNQHVLGIIGGGGAARSTAAAWAERGGRINSIGGRRELMNGPWDQALTDDEANMTVNFEPADVNAEHPNLLNGIYVEMEGPAEERLRQLAQPPYDGRWLLVAQHLACWRWLWAPELADSLPSLDLLLTRLVEAETTLAEYA